MNRITFAIGLFLCVLTSFSQIPQSFSYQAVARDNSGNVIANQQVSIKISILQGSITGSSVYSETATPTTNQFGLINLLIGQGLTIDNFSAINWSSGQYFLKIEMDEAGGNSYKLMGTTQLVSVPFALYAANAPSSFNFNYPDGFENLVNITQEINTINSYTVPVGKNLYIQFGQRRFKINSDTINKSYAPLMIAGPNSVIKGIENAGFISGFLVDEGVTAMTINLRNGDFVVPNGQIFTLYAYSNNPSMPYINLTIDGVNINPNGCHEGCLDSAIILTSGKVLSGNSVINGYLKKI